MKGLSPRQRAQVLVRKFRDFTDCVCFEVDGKVFEAHVNEHLLAAEHSIYKRAYVGDAGLRRLLRFQERLECDTPSNIKFSRPAGRASGDYNTGMGNSLIMLCVVVGVLRSYGLPFDVAVDGDNALVFMSKEHSLRVLPDFGDRVRGDSGLVLTLEKPVSVIEKIRFGKSAPVLLDDGYTMVRDYRSVMSNGTASHRHLRHPKAVARWLKGVAQCELSLAAGLPVLQAWSLRLLELTGDVKAMRAGAYRDQLFMGAVLGESKARPISAKTRESFAIAFDLLPDQQLEVEALLGKIGLEIHPIEVIPPSLHDWRVASPGVMEPWALASFYS